MELSGHKGNMSNAKMTVGKVARSLSSDQAGLLQK